MPAVASDGGAAETVREKLASKIKIALIDDIRLVSLVSIWPSDILPGCLLGAYPEMTSYFCHQVRPD
jgi:hypothetical protein